MLLRNHDVYRDLMQVDIDSGERERIHLAGGESSSSEGFFFDYEGRLFGMGTESGEIYLILADRLVKFDAAIATTLDSSADSNTFIAKRGSDQFCYVSYTPTKASGWTPNEDDECLDGFLLMHNVLNSAERRLIFIENNSNANSQKTG